tara:strand:+ start:1321 stop:2745 length:1425 start_codon:yes stop_codon:yes gene_type:complete
MSLGSVKAALLAAAGAGGDTGWIAVPSGTNIPGNWYAHYVDTDGNMWLANTNGDTSNSDAPLIVILADGSVGAANDWKLIDATNTRPSYMRGICVNGSNVFGFFQTANSANIQMGFTCGFSPGTLAPNYNKSYYESGGRDFYGHVNAIRPFDSDSNAVAGYGYNSGYNRFHAYISLISTATGAVEIVNGGTADTILFESNSGANSVYPTNPCKQGDFLVVGIQYQAQRAGYVAQNTTNSTAYRQYYTDASGTIQMQGVCPDPDNTTHLYLTASTGSNTSAHLTKVAMNGGAVSWTRRIQVTNVSGISSMSNPCTDSAGNVYIAFAAYDTQSVVDTAYRIHWAKYNSSGTLQQIDSTNTRCLFLSPEHGQPIYGLQASIGPNDEFIYINAYNNAGTPIVARLPLDGSGTQSGAYSVAGKSFYYRNDVASVESSGFMSAGGTDGSYACNNDSTQTNTGFNAAAQIASPAVASATVE